MQDEPRNSPEISEGSDEKQLCIRCMVPNEPEAHFCAECGTPLTSYASTGPFESIFAEASVYRTAAETPRSFIVVLGIWMIFGAMALAGAGFILVASSVGWPFFVVGGALVIFSVMMLSKTTWNYVRGKVRGQRAPLE